MDEHEFRDTLRSVNQRPCVFEKCILSRHAACAQAHRHSIAERETVQCTCGPAHQECAAVLRVLQEKALFTLGMTATATALPHAKALRLQAGGLQGLRRLIDSAAAPDSPLSDVSGLVEQLRVRYGGIRVLPFETVVQAIAAFRGRRRSRGREG